MRSWKDSSEKTKISTWLLMKMAKKETCSSPQRDTRAQPHEILSPSINYPVLLPAEIAQRLRRHRQLFRSLDLINGKSVVEHFKCSGKTWDASQVWSNLFCCSQCENKEVTRRALAPNETPHLERTRLWLKRRGGRANQINNTNKLIHQESWWQQKLISTQYVLALFEAETSFERSV